MKRIINKIRIFFGIRLTEEEREEALRKAKEYAYKHTVGIKSKEV